MRRGARRLLQLVLGGAGTGKTEHLYEKIREAVDAGRNVIFLVPEQASFESERQLYRRLNPQKALAVEVLSFTRLCHRVFRTYGGLSGIFMEDNAKLLLMSVALESVQDTLQIYRKNTSGAFVESMCAAIHEMKSAGVQPAQLHEAAAIQDTEESEGKLHDIALIFEACQALVEQGYDDPDDHLIRAAKMLEGSGFFKNTHIFIDGFTALMGAEWKLLHAAFSGGADITAALCCEGFDAVGGVFAAAGATARRLTQIAAQCGVTVAPPVKLKKPLRFQAEGLAALANEFPLTCPEFSEQVQGVTLTQCDDLYDEVETVAARICTLVREQGYRYRDIVVIARDTQPYQSVFETVFARFDIPYFDDRRIDAAVYPLIRGVLCALDAVQSGFQSEYLLDLAKCGLLGFSVEQTGHLENYCYVWNVTRKAWRTPFTSHPDGLKASMNEEACLRLALAEQAREILMSDLLALEQALENCDGVGFASAVYQYLQQIQCVEHLHEMAEEMPQAEAKTFLEEGAQIWDALMGVLDIFGGVLGGMRYGAGRFIDLLHLCLERLQVGMVPQTLDQVLVGGADRIRPNEPKAVFVIGLNEGRFPAWYGNNGLLSEGERERLREVGVDLLHTAEKQALLESYYVYYALTRASHALYLSWPGRDTAGRGLAKSSAVHHVEQIFPGQVRYSATLSPLERIGNEKSAMDFMARAWRTSTQEQAVLRAWLCEHAPAQYAALEQVSNLRPYRLETPQGQALFAGEIRLSPSRLEKYALCPFSFFCESGLGLHARRRAEFDPLESGTMVHYILQEMVGRYGGKALAQMEEARLRTESAGLLQKALEEKIQGKEMPRRFQYLFARQVETVVVLLRHLGEEFSQSAFVPAELELRIRTDAPCKPLMIQGPDGFPVIVEGVVDRLDLYETPQKRYLRVVDYKTGIKKFDLSDISQGLNLQMLIYLFSLCDSYGGESAWRNTPAGVLYMPARAEIIEARREIQGEKLEAMHDDKLKMNGLLLNERSVLEAMEPGVQGRFIPAKLSGGVLDSRKSTVLSQAQFAQIRGAVESQLGKMVSGMKAGHVEALPALRSEQTDGKSVCDFCEYAMICLHEADDPCRALRKLDFADALEELGVRKEGEDGTAAVDATAETGD